MRTKIKTNSILFFCFACIMIIISCKKDKVVIVTDEQLYDMARETAGFTWFKNSGALLNKSSGTGHSQPFLRTRFNAIAATKLGSDGKILSGAQFPEGSLIVKELFINATTIERYAILYKKSESAEADANGWVWGYINANGDVAIPAAQKGGSCIGCHSQSDNIDYMLMNKYFP